MSPMLIGLLLLFSLALIVYALMPTKNQDQEAIRRRISGKRSVDETVSLGQQAKVSVAQKLVQKVAPFANKPVTPKNAEEMSRLNIKLANAGLRQENTASIFLASKSIVAVLMGMVVARYV